MNIFVLLLITRAISEIPSSMPYFPEYYSECHEQYQEYIVQEGDLIIVEFDEIVVIREAEPLEKFINSLSEEKKELFREKCPKIFKMMEDHVRETQKY